MILVLGPSIVGLDSCWLLVCLDEVFVIGFCCINEPTKGAEVALFGANERKDFAAGVIVWSWDF